MYRLSIIFISVIFISNLLAGCQLIKKQVDSVIPNGDTCADALKYVRRKTDIGGLNLVHQMYHRKCYEEVISAARYIREQFRDQTISVTRDLSEVIFYEGTFVDYQMEAYERTYLSLLVALSYYNLKQIEQTEVELRKAYNESIALLETKGQDRITLLMMALLWENLGKGETARPLYRRIVEISGPTPDEITIFANKQALAELKGTANWHITEHAKMPELIVNHAGPIEFRYPPLISNNANGGKDYDYTYFKIKECKENSTLILSTDDWLKFLFNRMSNSDNPKTKLKLMARLPMTMLYSTVVFAAGAALTVETAKLCANGGGGDCGKGVLGMAVLTVVATGKTFNAGTSGDLRYWEDLPQAISISNGPTNSTKLNCLKIIREQPWYTQNQLF